MHDAADEQRAADEEQRSDQTKTTCEIGGTTTIFKISNIR
jgi:hypothetical protein